MLTRGLANWASSSGSYRMYTTSAMDLTDVKIALSLEGLTNYVYRIQIKDANGQYRDVSIL